MLSATSRPKPGVQACLPVSASGQEKDCVQTAHLDVQTTHAVGNWSLPLMCTVQPVFMFV